jgi:hypothetical protein
VFAEQIRDRFRQEQVGWISAWWFKVLIAHNRERLPKALVHTQTFVLLSIPDTSLPSSAPERFGLPPQRPRVAGMRVGRSEHSSKFEAQRSEARREGQ